MSIDAVLEKARRLIAEHGWTAFFIFGGGGSSPPAFTYSVGMQQTFGAPDALIFGLDQNTAHSYLAHAADEARKGTPVKPGRLPGFFQDFDGWALEIEPKAFREHFKVSLNLYPGMTRGLQLVYPDAKGKWPWEKGSQYAGKVPLLGVVPKLE